MSNKKWFVLLATIIALSLAGLPYQPATATTAAAVAQHGDVSQITALVNASSPLGGQIDKQIKWQQKSDGSGAWRVWTWNGSAWADQILLMTSQEVAEKIAHTLNLPDGEMPTVTPTVAATATALPTGAPTLTPTNTAVPTAAPTTAPTVTPMPTHDMSMMGECGENMMVWHAPTVNGCATGHEHGDAPPAWVMNSGYQPMFMHAMSTSAIENTLKHACMKGYAQPNGAANTEWYLIHHGCSMPFDRLSQYHSWQLWIREKANGNLTYLSGWVDYGDPKNVADGGNRVPTSQFDEQHNGALIYQGIVRVDTRTTPVCEQWYSAVGGFTNKDDGYWQPDFAWLACGSVTAYTAAERAAAAGNPPAGYDPYNPANWVLTGGLGFDRQIDFSIYDDRIADKRGRTFWHDQFGTEMTGANDPRCGQNVVGGDGKTYVRQCVENKVSPTLGTVKDILRKNYFAEDVHAPN